MGPFSFMTGSILNRRSYERFMIKDPTKPFTVDLRVLDSFVDHFDAHSLEKLHSTSPNISLTRYYMSPGVQEHDVWDGRVRGTLYLPAGVGPFPGVISMSGGYPGAMKYKAALLASHGFAAIALRYFGVDDLPAHTSGVDLSYFEEAALFLRGHPKVDGRNGVGIIANCFGGNVAIALASLCPRGLIRSVVSTSGLSYNLGGIPYNGKRFRSEQRINMDMSTGSDGITHWKYGLPLDGYEDDPLRLADSMCFPIHKRPETALMLVAGGEDGYFMDLAKTMRFHQAFLKASNHPEHKVLFYPRAGHLIEHSFYPFCDVVWTFNQLHFVGGTQPYHAKAQVDAWPQILEFTRRHLLLPGKTAAKL